MFEELSLTLAIVIATSAITIVAFYRPPLLRALLIDVGEILGQRTQWWRMFTSGLVHGDYGHLFFNMMSLYFFGSWLEMVIEPWRYSMVYVVGIVFGSFVAVIVHRRDPSYLALGASGGVCAVIGAATVIYPQLPMMVFLIPVAIPAWIYGMLFVFFSVYAAQRSSDAIGHEAHLGGTFIGITLVAAFYPVLALEHWPYILSMFAAGAGGWFAPRILRRGRLE